jgi:hypothetical protein
LQPDGTQEWWVHGRQQSNLDREQTRRRMTQAARWSPLRAAFVGAAVAGEKRSAAGTAPLQNALAI